MEKPITVIYEDFKQELADMINNSGLPAFLIESILQIFLDETKVVVNRQYQLDKLKYEKYLEKTNSKVNNIES